MEDKILSILVQLRPESDFSNSSDFIEEGLLDSLDIVALIDSIEEEYGVVIPGVEILPENFASIPAIIQLINKYQNVN